MIKNIEKKKLICRSGTQGPLNLIFTSYQHLDKKWNCSYVINKHYRKCNEIGIIHYKGRVKPWHKIIHEVNEDISNDIYLLYKKLWIDYRNKIII